ncbi:bifunctional 3-deoxy-7-phosphoheptulonate synthase/chorismate mutase [Paenibacillus validus]|uniref:3-deoxy-7-phosphoheptulonate synthase n=1 Tax=Paenibacillus validus TaxID=44253 RepID=A0A7X3CTY4_9BACL|nr:MULTISPECIES: bifunctional 3-deoxy-7-phosphoheptulonate synthase/chorismate mutase [Paenibacillus]MED4599239.1 bifunctional 3-deoxy-7-phosphoheptulonate synthase/chorismate mutase [Paenibacillus validus]MED4606454.1 bifunctional 3-deoxy-7-phosphoheptulonate synthase/chorismate mutase [Paenibacillus validus]MUG71514.1 3-deoxy-7-phosphoheptulonate synthase [Paenibacillus validus]
MSTSDLEALRNKLDEINVQILELISNRAEIVEKIGIEKQKQGIPRFDPVRESRMLENLVQKNKGPFDDATVRHLFKQIFKASLELLEEEHKKHLLVTRKRKHEDTVIHIKGVGIGGPDKVLVAGPCTVESYGQMYEVAASLKAQGVTILRGGAYKSRTSPYDFQGLGKEGLEILHKVGGQFGMITVSEIMDSSELELAGQYIDMVEIGAKNMQNFSLLKAVGDSGIPVLLKRGNSATLEELLLSAEYIVSRGNAQVILMERGIRTYEKWTRNTLDISAVPILKKESHLPVLVDLSHSTGRKDIVLPCAKAALAAGADGLLVEVHPDPSISLSDGQQQLDLKQFAEFYRDLNAFQPFGS